MRYSMGDTLADKGFSLLEKLHSPIFLVQKNGAIKKINEAGRKLLKVAHLSAEQVEAFAKSFATSSQTQFDHLYIESRKKHFKVITRQLGASDYILVEILR